MPEYDPATDPRSSNNLIHGYLQSKGLPLTSENVRRALEANAREPGLIRNDASSLVNSTPSTEADDQRAMAAAAAARAGRGGGGGIPTPPVPPAGGGGGGGDPNTSAAPDDTSGMPLWQQILAGAATGLGFGGASRLRRGAGEGTSVGEPGAPDVRLSMAAQPEQRLLLGSDAQMNMGDPLRIGAPEPAPGPEPRVRLGAPPEALAPAGVRPPIALPAPPLQIAGPPGPGADARPVANPREAIPLTSDPVVGAIDKAVGGEGDAPARTRTRTKAQGAKGGRVRVRVPG